MWTGGFPEPLHLQRCAPRRHPARPRAATSTSCTTTRPSATACSAATRRRCRWSPPSTTRSPSTGALELAAAHGLAQRLVVRRWYGFTADAGAGSPAGCRPCSPSPSTSRARDRRRTSACDPTGSTSSRIGADTDVFSPDPSVPRVPGRIVTTSSADVPLKGLVHLVEALAKLRTERPTRSWSSSASRAADGPVAQPIERLRPRRTPSVRQGHHRRRAGRPGARREVACVPSLYEGFSLPAAEAMACAAPRWSPPPAARSPRSRAATASACLRCRPATRARWPRALGRLLDDPRAAGAAARRAPAGERVLARFTWARGRPRRTVAALPPSHRRPAATSATPPNAPRRQGHVLTVDFDRLPARARATGCSTWAAAPAGTPSSATGAAPRSSRSTGTARRSARSRSGSRRWREAGEAPAGAERRRHGRATRCALPFPDDELRRRHHLRGDGAHPRRQGRARRDGPGAASPAAAIAVTVPRYGAGEGLLGAVRRLPRGRGRPHPHLPRRRAARAGCARPACEPYGTPPRARAARAVLVAQVRGRRRQRQGTCRCGRTTGCWSGTS